MTNNLKIGLAIAGAALVALVIGSWGTLLLFPRTVPYVILQAEQGVQTVATDAGQAVQSFGAALGQGHQEIVRWIFARGANFGGKEQTTIDVNGNIASSATLSAVGITDTGTSTLAVTANQPYIITASFGSATTTYVGTQYTGPTVAVDAAYLDFDSGSSANTVNSQWRVYLSKAVADTNTNATGTLMKQIFISSSSLQIAYGGPVPSSYYTSSTAQLTGISGGTTTTPIMMYNGDFYNVTSTAITSSTGRLKLLVHQY